MAKATITSKNGLVITIEGNETEISEILSKFESTPSLNKTKDSQSKQPADRVRMKKRANSSDLILTLKDEGFFDKPKGLSDIAHALEEKGYMCPITSLSGVVLSLVQRRYLGRKKAGGKWTYGK